MLQWVTMSIIIVQRVFFFIKEAFPKFSVAPPLRLATCEKQIRKKEILFFS